MNKLRHFDAATGSRLGHGPEKERLPAPLQGPRDRLGSSVATGNPGKHQRSANSGSHGPHFTLRVRRLSHHISRSFYCQVHPRQKFFEVSAKCVLQLLAHGDCAHWGSVQNRVPWPREFGKHYPASYALGSPVGEDSIGFASHSMDQVSVIRECFLRRVTTVNATLLSSQPASFSPVPLHTHTHKRALSSPA